MAEIFDRLTNLIVCLAIGFMFALLFKGFGTHIMPFLNNNGITPTFLQGF